jgi:hypothetical protein
MSHVNTSSVRARHLAAIIPAFALAALITACNVGTVATPPPSSPPSNDPTTLPATPPGPTQTPTPVPTPTLNPEQIQHPTGATDIVLRMEEGGGFVPFGFFITQAPQFTLYGDGTVIFQQIDNRQGSFDLPKLPWLVGHVDEEGVQALLQFALSTGRLLNAKESYDNPMVADAGSTIFTLNAGGLSKVVNVYALFEMPDPGPDAADRAGFSQLRSALIDFQNQEGIGELTEYVPDFYKVVLLEGFGEPTGEVADWPWDDLTTDDFPAGDEPGGIAILDAEHVSKLMDVPNGGTPGIWVHDPDGTLVQLGVRPLLPDENPDA